jgi:hypothetical protein
MTSSVAIHKSSLSGTGTSKAITNPASILDSTKKILGFDADYTVFDLDIVTHINSAFGELAQLGVGSETGFVIEDRTTLWSQYTANLAFLGMIKQFMYMSVRLAFDPPERFALAALKEQIEKLSFRINVAAERFSPPSDPFVAGDQKFVVEVRPLLFEVKVVNLHFEAVITPDASVGNTFYLTVTDDCTVNAPVSGVDGEHITLVITSNGHTVHWGNGWNFGGAGLPVLSLGGITDVISGVWNEADAQWYAGFTPGF